MCCCFCNCLCPAVGVRMCPGRCIEVSLCNVSLLLVIETHLFYSPRPMALCVLSQKKLSEVCSKHLSVLVVARIGKIKSFRMSCGCVVLLSVAMFLLCVIILGILMVHLDPCLTLVGYCV